MALGLGLNTLDTKTKLQEDFRKPFNNFETRVDDVLPLAPVGIMYSADLLKLKARNSVWNQTKYLAISEITSVGIVLILKNTLKILRPDSSSYNSFPSGHTTIAFTSSQVLFNEFYQTNKIVACSGLLFSISTGSLRVINNRHWVPDVLMGAGIGILVTNLVYHIEPLKNWNPWKKWNKNLSFQPSISTDYLGANFKLKL
jgi:membrane-associated phospholipid phosphatase